MNKVPKDKAAAGFYSDSWLFGEAGDFLHLSDPQLKVLSQKIADFSVLNWNEVRCDREVRAFKHKIIQAGYTYLGQFIGHDLSFVSFGRSSGEAYVKNQVTPRLDLDGLYGRGPGPDPLFYSTAPNRFGFFEWQEAPADLRRSPPGHEGVELPLIPDARNDDNIFISQLHLAFQRVHNRLLYYVQLRREYRDIALEVFFQEERTLQQANESKVHSGKLKHGSWGANTMQLHDFKQARSLLVRLYHWIILEDFLFRLIHESVLKGILGNEDILWQLRWYTADKRSSIPLEFSLACFRFGHSMIRGSYSFIKIDKQGSPVREEELRIFQPKESGKRVREFTVDWARVFSYHDCKAKSASSIDLNITSQMIKEIGKIDGTNKSIIERNLAAGNGRLLSGQKIAELMGLEPLQLRPEAEKEAWLEEAQIDPNNLPLWIYTLLESDKYYDGVKLGPVAGRIVAEVIIGLIGNDESSYLNQNPSWTPCSEDFNKHCTCHKGKNHPEYEGKCTYTMVDFLKFAGVYEPKNRKES
jgi:hypothetical protein